MQQVQNVLRDIVSVTLLCVRYRQRDLVLCQLGIRLLFSWQRVCDTGARVDFVSAVMRLFKCFDNNNNNNGDCIHINNVTT